MYIYFTNLQKYLYFKCICTFMLVDSSLRAQCKYQHCVLDPYLCSMYLSQIMITPYNIACFKHFCYTYNLMWLELGTKLVLTTCNVYNCIGVIERKRRVQIEIPELNSSILNEEYANFPPHKKGITLLSK